MSFKTSNSNLIVYWIVLSSLILGIILCLAIALAPFELLNRATDQFAPDGELESFTPELASTLRIPATIMLVMLFSFAVIFILRKRRVLIWVGILPSTARSFVAGRSTEIKEFVKWIIEIEPDRRACLLVLGIIILAALIRIAYLWRPMGHDETYTFIAFASRGLRITMTDYHLPNNHVFHTLLVFVSTRLFGDSPAAIRLPALLTGVLIVPAAYLAGRVFYGKETGLVGATLAASAPVLVDYSTNARGYSIMALFTILILVTAEFVREHQNLFAWALLVILCGLGLYTNPTMVYPICILYSWLVLGAVFHRVDPGYGPKIYFYILLSALSIGVLSLLLYTPVILYSGYRSLIGNNIIAPLSWSDFIESIPVRIRNTWDEWHRETPDFVRTFGLIGFGASVIFPIGIKKRIVPLILPTILSIAALLLIQRVAPWPRIWLFLLPLAILWSSAGILYLFRWIIRRLPGGRHLFTLILSILVVVPLGASTWRSHSFYNAKTGSFGEVEKAAEFLSGALVPGDVVVVTSPDAVVLDYYLRRRDISRAYLDLEISGRQLRSAMVVVNSGYGQTIESVLLDRSFTKYVDASMPDVIYQANRITIYSLAGQASP